MSPLNQLLLPLMGAVALLGLHHLWLWLGRRTDSLPLWVLVWCANTLLFLASHHTQVTALTEHGVALGTRLAWVSAALLAAVIVGLGRAVTGRPASGRPLLLAALASAVLAVLALVSDLLVRDQVYTRTDLLGHRYPALVPGPLAPVVAVYIIAILLYTYWDVRRHPGTLEPGERRWIQVGFAVYGLLALNDALHSARLIQSVRVFDLGFVAVAVGLTYLLTRRHNRLQTRLEALVTTRTGESEERRQRLVALLEISRRLTAELGLPAVLDSISSAAAEVFRGEAGFRLVEGDWLVRVGGTPGAREVMPRERLRIGESVSGMVAATGQPYLTVDTAADARVVPDHRGLGQPARTGALMCVPVRMGARILGTLNVYGPRGHRFDDEALTLARSLADQAGIAIENARLYEASRGQADELLALREVGTALVSTLDMAAVLEAVAHWAVRLLGCQNSAVFQLDPRDGLLHARTPPGAEPRPVRVLRPGQGAIGAAFARRAPVWSEDVRAQEPPGYADEAVGTGHPLGEVARTQSFRAVLAVPVESRDRALGAIAARWAQPHLPTEREIRLLTAFARSAAVALENATLHEALAARFRRLETLTGLNRLISSSLERDRVLSEITRAAAELAGARMACLWVATEASRSLELLAVSDPALRAEFPVPRLAFGEGLAGWVATERRPLGVPDVLIDARVVAPEWWQAHGLRSFHGVPVIHEGALVAVACLFGSEPFRFEGEDQQLLDALVAQAATAIHNASLYEAALQARREAELALAQVKTLHGLLPICAYCKKIRDDRNYWERIETYVSQRSQATFSHGICPECLATVVARQLAELEGRDR